jgi:sirohydrochlorin cobaltochelatase
METSAPDTLILFAHGARDAGWRVPVDALAARLRAAQPGLRVEPAFLDFMQPPLAQAVEAAVAGGARRVAVAPVFWAPGGHLRTDVPMLLEEERRRHPGVRFELWPAMGECPEVLDALTEVYGALWRRGG